MGSTVVYPYYNYIKGEMRFGDVRARIDDSMLR